MRVPTCVEAMVAVTFIGFFSGAPVAHSGGFERSSNSAFSNAVNGQLSAACPDAVCIHGCNPYFPPALPECWCSSCWPAGNGSPGGVPRPPHVPRPDAGIVKHHQIPFPVGSTRPPLVPAPTGRPTPAPSAARFPDTGFSSLGSGGASVTASRSRWADVNQLGGNGFTGNGFSNRQSFPDRMTFGQGSLRASDSAAGRVRQNPDFGGSGLGRGFGGF